MADPHALHDIDDQIARVDAEIAQLDDHLLDLQRLADHIGAVRPPASPRDVKFIQDAFELIRDDIDGVGSSSRARRSLAWRTLIRH
jgi:hypothetical protein